MGLSKLTLGYLGKQGVHCPWSTQSTGDHFKVDSVLQFVTLISRLSFKTYLASILYFSSLDNPKSSLVPRHLDLKWKKKSVLFSSYDYIFKYVTVSLCADQLKCHL